MKRFIQGFISAIIVLTAAWLFEKAYPNYMAVRKISFELLTSMNQYREEVNKSLLSGAIVQKKNIGSVGEYIEYIQVQSDGTIIGKAKDGQHMLILVPSVKDHEVIWACIGVPRKNVPTTCKGT